jgi:hypothetical protein
VYAACLTPQEEDDGDDEEEEIGEDGKVKKKDSKKKLRAKQRLTVAGVERRLCRIFLDFLCVCRGWLTEWDALLARVLIATHSVARIASSLTATELKQMVPRPDVVEPHDVAAKDPRLLIYLKVRPGPLARVVVGLARGNRAIVEEFLTSMLFCQPRGRVCATLSLCRVTGPSSAATSRHVVCCLQRKI